VWNNICKFLESKDGERRHKSKTNEKSWLGRSRPVIAVEPMMMMLMLA
jgi:hypothetical protein